MAKAKALTPLIQLPRWREFVRRYATDLPRFATEVCGRPPTPQQLEYYESVQQVGSRTSTSSGHGCFALGTQMMRTDGTAVAVEDIIVGDQLMGPDGDSVRNVLELKRGREAMYRFTYADGSSHVFNESHILCLVGADARPFTAIVRDWLAWPEERREGVSCYRLTAAATDAAEATYARLFVAAVEPLGEGDYFGFVLDGDSRFLGHDCTVFHNTGKTEAAAITSLWHLTCYKFSNTILTGPKLEIVLSGVRKYMADMLGRIEEGPQAWIAPYIVIAHKQAYIRGFKSQWWVMAKTAPAGKPEAMAGEHRRFLLWLADEASGIDDKVMGVILGSLTEEWNRIALFSQPTRASGLFYDSHHKLSKARGGTWTNITMNSEESPLVSDQFIEEKLLQYGGTRDDPQYQIKVRGMFPDKLEGQLLARAQLEACIGRPSVIRPGEGWGWAVLVDVAAGEFRDKSVIMVAKVSGHGQMHEAEPRRMHVVRVPVMSSTIQPTDLIGQVIQVAATLENPTIMVDAGGMGLFVYKKLEELGLPGLKKVIWGAPCWRKALKESYYNQRAQAMVCAAKAAIHGHLSIAKDAFTDSRHVSEFLDQSRIPYRFNELAQYVIHSKGSKEWEGLPSPDAFDALSFGFLEQCQFVPVQGAAAREGQQVVASAVERMRARRAAAKATADNTK